MALTASNEGQHLPSPFQKNCAAVTILGDTLTSEVKLLKSCATAPSDSNPEEQSGVGVRKIVVKLKRRKMEREQVSSQKMAENEAQLLPKARKRSQRKQIEARKWFKFSVALSPEEIMADLSEIFGPKPPGRLSRRPRAVQAAIDSITPGSCLRSMRLSVK